MRDPIDFSHSKTLNHQILFRYCYLCIPLLVCFYFILFLCIFLFSASVLFHYLSLGYFIFPKLWTFLSSDNWLLWRNYKKLKHFPLLCNISALALLFLILVSFIGSAYTCMCFAKLNSAQNSWRQEDLTFTSLLTWKFRVRINSNVVQFLCHVLISQYNLCQPIWTSSTKFTSLGMVVAANC